jgi:hypothetical protein
MGATGVCRDPGVRCPLCSNPPEIPPEVKGFQSKYWGWWYVTIGLGFLLLAIVNTMRGARLAGIVIRIVIAIGFALLGWMQFRYGR